MVTCMGVLKCTFVTMHYWNFLKLQEEAEHIWKLRQEKLEYGQDTLSDDIELHRLCGLLEESANLCTHLERYTLRKRQLSQLNVLLYLFNEDIQYCACFANVRRYLMGILLEVFHFGVLQCQFPDYVLDLFQDVLQAYTGAKSPEIEQIRNNQVQLKWKCHEL